MVSTEASPAPDITFAHMLAGVAGMIAAALLLVWQPDALLTRWHPATLAAVHLFALGGLMPVMLGALFQFVPVACGLSLPRWGRLDGWILVVLMLGSLTLAGSFLQGSTLGFGLAGVLLLGSLLSVGARLAWALGRQAGPGELARTLLRSVLALAGTVSLASLLLGILIRGWQLPLLAIVDWHALWGIAGWMGGLIASVASMVVPMFHVTDAYPRRWFWLSRLVLMALLLGTFASWLAWGWLVSVAVCVLAVAAVSFGILTVRRVHASKRGEHDAFHWGWLGVTVLAVAMGGIGALAHFSPDARWGVAFGILALAGLGGGTVSVMVYRIVPFLIWLHWQRVNKARIRLPMLHQIVPERWQGVQLSVEGLSVLLLCAGAFFPALVLPAACGMALGKLGQWILLARAMRDYAQRLPVLKALPPRVAASVRL
ncbi:MAG: hypothetical protein H6R19_11 [Proteobacteria bacterium]|nr:hypothetical protein [Pseudomonadota bacterium]